MAWWLWMLIGVLALAGESATMALFLLYVGIAAFAAAVVALFDPSGVLQVGLFLALSIALIGLVRPRMINALAGRVPHRTLTNQGSLIDRVGVVTQPVTAHGGMIRIGNAEFWSARTTMPAERIEAGRPVRVAYVDGLTAYVTPVSELEETPTAPGVSFAPDMAHKER